MELVVGASSDAVKSLVGKLGSLLAQEYTLIQGVRDDIQYINDELASMQAFLTKTKRATSHDEQRQDWMKQVREVSYDIEDCVDNVNHRLGHEPRGTGFRIYIQRKWYFLTTLYARRCIATEIGNLKIRAHQVSERRIRYGVDNLTGTSDKPGGDIPVDRVAPPPELIGTRQPVGVEDAIKELEGWFGDGKRFLAIFGFGGLGKTTLAMELYRKFGDKFEYRASVQASQKFNPQILLKSLVKQFHQQQAGASLSFLGGIEELKETELKEKLALQLENKRYLILIDDIWSVSAWDKINDSLPAGGKVVVTTRFKSVAVACCRQNGYLYDHKPLDENKPYCLFRQIITTAPVNPSNDVKVLLEKCGGLPLAIIVIAGLVASKLRSGGSSKKTLDEHLKEVAKAWSGGLSTTNLTTEGVTEILDKCYNDLRADLKTCLLYLSMFPKGSFISRKRLIRRWIAEGFVIEKHGKTLQEVAEDYFNELIDRNLIRAVSSSSNGKVKNYQIHDMVLEYIIYKSSDENFITVVGGHWQTPFPSYKVRRLSVHRSVHEEKGTVERMKLSHVRSLSVSQSIKALHSCLHKFQILQVLDLEGGKDLSFHQAENICEMHQLKYLSLRKTDIKEIPYEIGSLEYLEVLDIRETEVKKLPPSVDRLERMTHLLTGNKSKRKALIMTEEITKMTALQTLSGMGISGSSTAGMTRSTGRTVSCKEVLQALEKLTKLKKLSICILGKLKESDHESLLSAIEHLSSCSLKFLAIDDGFTGFLDNSFSFSEAPPEHLQTLELSGMLSKVPKWIDRLQSLEKLTLSLTSFTRENLLVLGELPELFSLIFTLHTTMSRNPGALRILHKNTLESEWEIIIPPGGFEKLKLLRFSAPTLPPLSFADGAMPVLQRLELKFGSVDGVHGLQNLVSLRQVFLTVSSKSPEAAEEIKRSVHRIGKNPPTVIVDEYNESSVEQ